MTELDAFIEAWANTGRAEGGYVNNPKDPGGETNWGITVKVARNNGYTGPMKDLPSETAQEIARKEYWLKPGLSDIATLSRSIALELFDTNFNLYYGFAMTSLQRALNALNRNHLEWGDVVVDGRFGTGTFDALKKYLQKRASQNGERMMLRILNSLQGAEYIRQAEANQDKREFLFGWFAKRVVIEDVKVDER